MAERFKLPMITIKDPNLVLFPGLLSKVLVGRPASLDALGAAQSSNSSVVVVYQKDPTKDNLTSKDVYTYAVEAEVRSVTQDPEKEGKYIAILCGLRRCEVKTFGLNDSGYYHGQIETITNNTDPLTEEVKQMTVELRDLAVNIPAVKQVGELPTNNSELSDYVDKIAGQLPIIGRYRLKLFRMSNPHRRLDSTMDFCAKLTKNEPVTLTAEPPSDAGGDDNPVNKFRKQMDECGIEGEALKVAKQELRRLSITPQTSSEYHVIYNYIETLLSLPWKERTEDKLNIEEAKQELDNDHYGLDKAKDRIVEFLAVKKLVPEKRGSILCFAGPPGTGKTSLGKSIAKAMGREFIRVSLGGIDDEAEIRGHRKTYIGSMPGKIMQQIRRCGKRNPVFMLDELDKVGRSVRGDPAAALLEVLDPEQNNSFVDNYLGVPFDLSEVMFIATVNDIKPIIPALKDRLEIIHVSGYSAQDKIQIAQKHLVDKKKKENGLEKENITISPNAITRIVEEYTNESGVRSLERECGTIMRKLAVTVASGKKPPSTIKVDMIPNYLGPPKLFADKAADFPEVGLSTGLSWSTTGGSILFVETGLTPGHGKIDLTGNLGKVLKESAQAALTWIKANADTFDIDVKEIKKHNVHIHFPAGAIPKDGPSAGIAIAASMLSSFLNKPVRNDVAMTGEISLRGRVLPIGGLREKVMAAHRAGIKKVIFPKKNEYSLDEIPQDVRNALVLKPVSNLSEALRDLIINLPEKLEEENDITVSGSEPLANKES